MGKVKIVLKGKAEKPKTTKHIASKKDFSLPTALSVPSDNLNDFSFLCYGRKKIGKTSLWGRRDKTLFFLFEPGAKSQSIYQVPTTGNCFVDWQEVIGYAKQLKKASHQFETAIFDTGKPAYELCLQDYCKREGIVHPGKIKDFGASWHGVTESFKSIHLLVASANMGFVVIAHERFNDFTGADGKEYTRVSPNFSGACNDFYEGVIDVICHYGYVGKERWLQIRGDESTVAGCRIENHFLTPKGAEIFEEIKLMNPHDPDVDTDLYYKLSSELGEEQIYKIPMGNHANISHSNLLKAFNNQQTETFKEVHDESSIKKVKRFTSKKKKLILKK